MDATQCRMARAGLGWTVDNLANKSGVNRRTILNFENGGPASAGSLAKLGAAFDAAGVVFIRRGVRLSGA